MIFSKYARFLVVKMADEFDVDVEENENKCLRFIEGSFKLLEQARAAVLSSRSSDVASSSSLSSASTTTSRTAAPSAVVVNNSSDPPTHISTAEERAVSEFKSCFPGLSKPISGRHLQTYFPSSASASRRFNPYHTPSPPPSSSRRGAHWSGKVANTWTHEFVCLSLTNASITPNSREVDLLQKAGLGKKKIIFKNKHGEHDHVKQTLEGYYPRYIQSDSNAYSYIYYIILLYI